MLSECLILHATRSWIIYGTGESFELSELVPWASP